MKAVGAKDPRHLLDRDIGIPTEVRNIARTVLGGKDQTDRVAMTLQGFIRGAAASVEFFAGRRVLAVDRGGIGKNSQDLVQVLTVGFGGSVGRHSRSFYEFVMALFSAKAR